VLPQVKRVVIAEAFDRNLFGVRLQIWRTPLTMVVNDRARIIDTGIHGGAPTPIPTTE